MLITRSTLHCFNPCAFRCFLRLSNVCSSPFKLTVRALKRHGQWQNKSLEVQSFDELNPVWMCFPTDRGLQRYKHMYSQIRLILVRVGLINTNWFSDPIMLRHILELSSMSDLCVLGESPSCPSFKNMSVRCGRVVVEWTPRSTDDWCEKAGIWGLQPQTAVPWGVPSAVFRCMDPMEVYRLFHFGLGDSFKNS